MVDLMFESTVSGIHAYLTELKRLILYIKNEDIQNAFVVKDGYVWWRRNGEVIRLNKPELVMTIFLEDQSLSSSSIAELRELYDEVATIHHEAIHQRYVSKRNYGMYEELLDVIAPWLSGVRRFVWDASSHHIRIKEEDRPIIPDWIYRIIMAICRSFPI